MDDGGRCVLVDVLSDPQLLQSFLDDGSLANSSATAADVAAALTVSNGATSSSIKSAVKAVTLGAKSVQGIRLNRNQASAVQQHRISVATANATSIASADGNNSTKLSQFSTSTSFANSDSKQVDLVTSSVGLSPPAATTALPGKTIVVQTHKEKTTTAKQPSDSSKSKKGKGSKQQPQVTLNSIPATGVGTSLHQTSQPQQITVSLSQSSFVQQPPTSVTFTTSSLSQVISSAANQPLTLRQSLNAPTLSWAQASQLQMAAQPGGQAMTMLPQHLVQVPAGALQQFIQTAGGQQVMLTRPNLGNGVQHVPGLQQQLPPGTLRTASGQLVQIIQTPTGPQAQLVQASPITPASTVQNLNHQQAPTVVVANKSPVASIGSSSSRAGNKQILPKPSGSPGVSSGQQQHVSVVASKQQGQITLTQQTTPSTTRTMVTTNSGATSNMGQLGSHTLQTGTHSLPATSTAATPQFVIGGQQASFIQGPNGMLMLNPMAMGLQGLGGVGHQQFVIQGPNGPVQLMLRQPNSAPLVTVSGAGPTMNTNTPLLSALTSQQPMAAQQQQQTIQRTINQPNQPHTFVISNQSPHSIAGAGQGLIASGRGQNIIFTRPQGINLGQQQIVQSQHQPAPQFIQINTPNGPMLVALQATPQPQTQQTFTPGHQPGTILSSSQLQQSIQTNSMQTQNAHQTLQSILAQHNIQQQQQQIDHQQQQQQQQQQTVATSNANIIFSPNGLIAANGAHFHQLQQHTVNPTTASPQKPTRTAPKSVNLADLLKESGILPESSPPASPAGGQTQQTRIVESDAATVLNLPQELTQQQQQATILQPQQQASVLMMPSQANQQPSIQLMAQPQSLNTPQLRLALAPDGSVILQPNIALTQNLQQQQQQPNQQSEHQQVNNTVASTASSKLFDTLKDSCGPNSSQPSPDSTTPTLDAVTPPATTTSVSLTVTTPTTTISTPPKSALIDQLNNSTLVKTEPVAPLQTQIKQEPSDDSKGTLIPLTVQNISLQDKTSSADKVPNQSAQVGETNNKQQNLIAATPQGMIITSTAGGGIFRIGNCDNAQASSLPFLLTTQNLGQSQHQPFQQINLSSNTINAINSAATASSAGVQVSQKNDVKPNLQVSAKNGQTSGEANKVVFTTLAGQPLNTGFTVNHDQSKSQTIQPNTHQQLVNILKQNAVGSQQQQIRLITSPMTSSSQGTAGSTTQTFQVGNQFITISTTGKPPQQPASVQNATGQQQPTQTLQLKPQLAATAPTLFQVVRLQQPTTQTSVATTSVATTTTTSSQSVKSSSKQENTHSDIEKQRAKVLKFFQQQLSADQNAATKPDVKTPFKNRSDACKRLLRYHVFNSSCPSVSQLETVDREFEAVSKNLLIKKQQLMDRYRQSVLKLSMKEKPSAECIMIDKLFINDETNAIKIDKEVVTQGRPLDLPPAPASWTQMIRTSIMEEEERIMFNRKRKTPLEEEDLEITASLPQIRKQEPNPIVIASVEQESDGSEDEDDDSDDEDDEDEDDGDITKLLEDTESMDDLTSLYDGGMAYDQPQHGIGTDLNNSLNLGYGNHNHLQQNDNNGLFQDWSGSRGHNSSYMSSSQDAGQQLHWPKRFADSEADVAVESILGQDDEAQISADLSAIAFNLEEQLGDHDLHTNEEDDGDEDDDDGDEDDDDEDDDDEDEEDSQPQQPSFHLPDSCGGGQLSSQSVNQPIDVQMQCAIDSILDIPTQQSGASMNPYYQPMAANTMGGYGNHRGYGLVQHGMHRGLHQTPFMSSSHQSNDPMLDEAVKSILS